MSALGQKQKSVTRNRRHCRARGEAVAVEARFKAVERTSVADCLADDRKVAGRFLAMEANTCSTAAKHRQA